MIIQAEKSFNDGKKLLLARYAGSCKELRTIIGLVNAAFCQTPQSVRWQFGLYSNRYGWSGDGSRFQKEGIVVDLLFGLCATVKAITPTPEVRIFIVPAASHSEPRPVQGKDFADVHPMDKVPTLVLGVQSGSGPNLPEVIQLLTCLKPPLAIPTDLCIVVLYDGSDLGNEEPSVKAAIAEKRKKDPAYLPPRRASGADMATVAKATTRHAYPTTEAADAVGLMRGRGLRPETVDYIVVLDHGVKTDASFAQTSQQWGSDGKFFSPEDAKKLAPFLKPFGAFVLMGCHAGEDQDAINSIVAASHRAVYANRTTETSIKPGTSIVLTSSKFNNRWAITVP